MRVVAVHGAAVNGATWMPLERILPVSVELIADDLPGHGEHRDEAFDFATAVGGIVAAARSAGPRTVLVGDSLGGYLVLAAGAQLGDAIAGVVAAVAGRVIVEPNAPHGVGILRPAAFAGAIASMQRMK